VHRILATKAIWTSGQAPEQPVDCQVQVRAHGGLAPATATPIDVDGAPGIRIDLHTPLRGVARGQAAVLYLPDAQAGDQVLGSGRIATTAAATPAT